MTFEELRHNDGRDGRPAYVAVGELIYDLSDSAYWKDGNHLNTHQAGCDLSEELKKAPHVAAVVERFPVVGRLEQPVQKKTAPIAAIMIPLVVIGLLLLAWIFW